MTCFQAGVVKAARSLTPLSTIARVLWQLYHLLQQVSFLPSGPSGVARILMKGVLKVNGQLPGHMWWGGRGMCPLAPKAEALAFCNIVANWCSLLILKCTA